MEHPSEFTPPNRIESNPTFSHSRLGRALRNGQLRRFPAHPLTPPKTIDSFEFKDGGEIEVIDLTDDAVVAEAMGGMDAELDNALAPETAVVGAENHTNRGDNIPTPPTISADFSLEDILDPDEEIVLDSEEDLTNDNPEETSGSTAFAEGIQLLFDEFTSAQLQAEIARGDETVDDIDTVQVDEPMIVVDGVNKSFFGRLSDKVRGKYRNPEKLRNPNRRRRVGMAVAGVAVAGLAVVSALTIRDGDTNSVTAGAPESITATSTDTAPSVSSGSTLTTITPATTPTTTPEAQVSADGVPGAISLTIEQYELMGTKQFADFAATLRANPNITQEEFAKYVAFAELVEQNQTV